MRRQNIDSGWVFGPGTFQLAEHLRGRGNGKRVDLPHDYMIAGDVRPDAPAGPASGFYTAGPAYYRRDLSIPADWAGERIFLCFDGAMMNAAVEVNGSRAALQHNGYFPFAAEITDLVYPGGENGVTVTVNPSMQPNSRWYSGAGIFRSVWLCHGPALHLTENGIYGYTESVEYAADGSADAARLRLEAEIRNDTAEHRIADAAFILTREGEEEPVLCRHARVQVPPMSTASAFQAVTVDRPDLWSAERPCLYRLRVRVTDMGVFKTRLIPAKTARTDEDEVLFGIRTVEADARHGLRINGRPVKLRGGCLHHDNGVIGAVSLYDAECRKIARMKQSGFNAVRTTHNPPSAALIEACDRLGMYVFNEAFDAWGMCKQPGDYGQFFDTDWEKDLNAFIRRDRAHPSVIIWSTGNEITERGGLGGGYVLADRLAAVFHRLDRSRPVSNGICSFWNGLDDESVREELRNARADSGAQNADTRQDMTWEENTACYANSLDIVGYNYLEHKYAQDHSLYPDRVILGSENFPNEIGLHWPMIEKTPYVIGDFTWTAWDYIGEAGIGRSVFTSADDPLVKKGPFGLMSHTSPFPWRLANDADFDITGCLTPQGVYRRMVWGSGETALFSYDPAVYGRTEVISRWGFTCVHLRWSWPGQEGRPVSLAVFSMADEAELFINGRSAGRLRAGERPVCGMPFTFRFDAVYQPGTAEAVGYINGREVSRSALMTCGPAAKLALIPERESLPADGHALAFVQAEIQDKNGVRVWDADERLTARAEGAGELMGFGSANPVTDENYASGAFAAWHGRALAVVRAGTAPGTVLLRVASERFGEVCLSIPVS